MHAPHPDVAREPQGVRGDRAAEGAARGPRVARAMALLALLWVGSGCATVWQGLVPQGPPAGSESARRLHAGPFDVARRDLRLVDASRPTHANGDFPGAPTRTLETSLWIPKAAPAPRPLVIYSHGFLSDRGEGAYLAQHLASHGYVVASADFPLSNRHAPGGPTLRDVASQPGDVTFLIDSLLDPGPASATSAVRIDPGRIGAVGLSLGGLTTTLVAFHPTLRDARVRVAVSVAGPLFLFSRRFFETAQVPFLVIASPDDAFVDYATNAAPLVDRSPGAALLTVSGASHAGFAHVSARVFRFWPNPDSVGCWYLRRRVDLVREGENPLGALGGSGTGVVFSESPPLPCQRVDRRRAMRPRRQHAITTLAVRAFLDTVLAAGPEAREAARRYLARGIALELPEVELRSPLWLTPRDPGEAGK
jgi:predicted dienelactone hydrolase